MRILVTNDDGIGAPGIALLAELAGELGEVYVVAPDEQYSAVSHGITIRHAVKVAKADFPVSVKGAWSVGGTPADCVKCAFRYILSDMPDVVLSGINYGYNTGFDACYSGTVGAAMEAVLNGIPAIAFSTGSFKDPWLLRRQLLPIARELLEKPLKDSVWNVNFPDCPMGDYKGIRRGVTPAPYQMYRDEMVKIGTEGGYDLVEPRAVQKTVAEVGDGCTDIQSVLNGYISIGRLKCIAL